jgi:arsenical pump membrane protein
MKEDETVMIATGIICGLTCLAMIVMILWKPQIKWRGIHFDTYPPIALLGCLALLLSGRLPVSEYLKGLTANTSVNPLKILVLFFSMTFLSVYLDEAGLFRYLAGVTLKKAGNSQKKLLLFLYLTVSLLTVFTSNDIVVLTFTPFICYFAKSADIDPIPYLVTEFVAANTFSMVFIIGNPTNIYLATSAGLGFLPYAKIMVLPTLAAGVVVWFVLRFLFRKQLSKSVSTRVELVKFKNRTAIVLGTSHLVVCTVLLVISSYVELPMWGIAAASAGSLILTTLIAAKIGCWRPKLIERSIARLPWPLVPFVLSMFALVLSLNRSGLSAEIAKLMTGGNAIAVYGIASVCAANLINNIPMSVLFSTLIPEGGGLGPVFASIIGSNLGAYLTPIGALAGIMWMSILKTTGVQYSFGRFTKYGFCVVIPALAAALLVLGLIL